MGLAIIGIAENYIERQAVCAACPFLKNGKKCGKCGCYIKAKCKIKLAKCPIGKWGKGCDVA